MSAPPAIAIVAILLLFIGGCGAAPTRSVSLDAWQASIEDYVTHEANGDPAALRDVTWAQTRKGFGLFGQAVPESSTDANGVLLGHRTVAGRPWFIFLVGLTRNRVVEDIRLAAVSFDGGRTQWQLSPPNTQALAAYKQYRQAAWRTIYVSRPDPPPGYMSFPKLEDSFELTITGNTIAASHAASGASWSLTVGTTPALTRTPRARGMACLTGGHSILWDVGAMYG